jgi:hypothetical protein
MKSERLFAHCIDVWQVIPVIESGKPVHPTDRLDLGTRLGLHFWVQRHREEKGVSHCHGLIQSQKAGKVGSFAARTVSAPPRMNSKEESQKIRVI